ncbi:MAG: hypothetical protein ACYCWW_16765, partial [Deltaproteobacteria bacterium]
RAPDVAVRVASGALGPSRGRVPGPMADDVMPLLYEASRLLSLSNAELGQLCGCSARTVQRWYAGQGAPAPFQLQPVACAVHPQAPELARRLAAAAGVTLAALGLGPKAAPPPAPLPLAQQADAAVYAAADAIDLPPKAVRPAVIAAFTRALALGADLAALGRHFAAEGDAARDGTERG